MRETLGDRIRSIRGSDSLPVFAKKMNVHKNTIARWERDETSPTVRQLWDVAIAGRCRSFDWLIRGVDLFNNSAPRQCTILEDTDFDRKVSKVVEQLIGLTVGQAIAVLQTAKLEIYNTCGVYPMVVRDTNGQSQIASDESAEQPPK